MKQLPRWFLTVLLLSFALSADQIYSQEKDASVTAPKELQLSADQAEVLRVFFAIINSNETPVQLLSDEFLSEANAKFRFSTATLGINATRPKEIDHINSMQRKINRIDKLLSGKEGIDQDTRPKIEETLLEMEREWKQYYDSERFSMVDMSPTGEDGPITEDIKIVLDEDTASVEHTVRETRVFFRFVRKGNTWLLNNVEFKTDN